LSARIRRGSVYRHTPIFEDDLKQEGDHWIHRRHSGFRDRGGPCGGLCHGAVAMSGGRRSAPSGRWSWWRWRSMRWWQRC